MLAAPLVDADWQAMTSRPGAAPFHKMSGSGNDFVVFDSKSGFHRDLETTAMITAICARGTGVGADGVVFLEGVSADTVRMRYYNADGSRATLCGNASLCSTRLAVELRLVSSEEFTLETDAGRLAARIRNGLPEVDLEPVEEMKPDANDLGIEPDERRVGYAVVGVPHVVVEVPDLERVDLMGRGSALRSHPSLRDGANVNFVCRAKGGGGWAYRTYERGVEGETLACGTGAVAVAALLTSWGKVSGEETVLTTRSGKLLMVRLRRDGSRLLPSLRGEGRIVFKGVLGEIT